jgi:hypothetical protein
MFDTGRPVTGPHEPTRLGADDEMREFIAAQHDAAANRLNAHRDELEEQTNFHEHEMARARRVLAACEAAMRELEDGQAVAAEPQAMQPPRWP